MNSAQAFKIFYLNSIVYYFEMQSMMLPIFFHRHIAHQIQIDGAVECLLKIDNRRNSR
jgi:hypothetical protein